MYTYLYLITINLLCQTDLKHRELQPTSQDGIRVSEPQALPDCLKGKALFPHVTWEMTKRHQKQKKQRSVRWVHFDDMYI